MDPQAVRAYQLKGFRLDLARRCLSANDGGTVVLSSRGYDVLAYLVENRHRVVGKDELIKAIWPRVIVEENSLSQAVSQARRALGDARESPQYIATIAGRGYQFVGAVQPVTDGFHGPDVVSQPESGPVGAVEAAAAAVEHPAATEALSRTETAVTTESHPEQFTRGRRALLLGLGASAVIAGLALQRWRSALPAIDSIAVLPFKPLPGGARDQAVEVGVAELLINRLSSVPGIVVSPMSSAIKFAAPEQDPVAAGRQLGVDAVVEGHVQIRDGHIRITARLLDTNDGAALWSGSFTEPMNDFFAVQDSLANRIASAVSRSKPLTGQDAWSGYGTLDAVAWQQYAEGRFQLQRRDAEGLRRARALFEAAQRRDPQFALAFAGHAEAWALAAIFSIEPTFVAFARARELAQRSLAVGPDLPDGHAALGHVLTQFDLDFSGGREQYRRALELRPDHAWSHALMALNLTQSSRPEESLRHIRQAQALEPAALPFLAVGGWVLYFADEMAEAERQLSRLVESVPAAALPTHFLARVLLTRGNWPAVLRMLEANNPPGPGSLSNLGRAYAQAGRIGEAQSELARIESMGRRGIGVGYDLALLQLELGNRAAAIEALARGVDDRSQMIGYLNVDPALDPLRDDAGFRAVARRIQFG